MEKLIKNKGDLWQYTDGGCIHGYTKTTVPEGDPFIAWKGEKMPHQIWQSILSFFIWTYEDTKKTSSPDEALVYLFYNEEEKQWLAWAPPQRGCGMSVKTVDDHPNWKQAEEFIGYIRVGTGHHHNGASAFQSGTDSADECTGNGLHFTIGHMDKDTLDIHARAVYNGNMVSFGETPVGELSDWVEMADKYKELDLPEELHYAAIYHSFKSRPGPEVQFPQAWRDNYIKWSSSSTTYSHCGNGQMGFRGQKDPPVGFTKSDGYWSTVNGVDHWVPFAGARPQSEGGQKKLLTLSAADKGELELENLLENRDYTLVEFRLLADKMAKLPRGARNSSTRMSQVNEILMRHGLNIRWFDKWIEDYTLYSNNQAWRAGA